MGILEELITRYPALAEQKDSIQKAYKILEDAFERGHKLLLAGNGGSSADCEHIAGELMKAYLKKRPLCDCDIVKFIQVDGEVGQSLGEHLQGGLPCLVLSEQNSLNTAWLNDVKDGADYLFAQKVNVLADIGDVLLAITTSGNSQNIVYAAITAKAQGAKVIALTGKNEGRVDRYADVAIKAPEVETFKVQEYHLPIYHALCAMLEEHFFEE